MNAETEKDDSGKDEKPPKKEKGEARDPALAKSVLDKLPEFAGDWDPEVQKKWFDALDRVVNIIQQDENK